MYHIRWQYHWLMARLLALLPAMLVCTALAGFTGSLVWADEPDDPSVVNDSSTDGLQEEPSENGEDVDNSQADEPSADEAQNTDEPIIDGYVPEIPNPSDEQNAAEAPDTGDPSTVEENEEFFDPKSWALYLAVQDAIEQGGKFTAPEALRWHRQERCSGCHIQTQSLMGLALAQEKDAKIDQQATNFLYNTIAASQHADGSLWISHGNQPKTQTGLGLWSMTGSSDKAFAFPTMYKAAQYFHNQRVDNKGLSYWIPDSPSYWWGTYVAQTALVTMGLAEVLKTAETIENVETAPTLDKQTLNEYQLLESMDLGGGSEVRDVEMGNDGALYVLKVNGQVNRIDLASGQTTIFVSGLPHYSTGLAIATDGTLYISGDHGRLIRATQGNWEYIGGIYYGRDIEIGPDGYLYLSDFQFHRILCLALDGTVKGERQSNGLNQPAGLAFDSEGNLYIANYAGYNILKMTPNGTITTFADGLPFPPQWLDVDSQAELYVSAKDFSFHGYTPYGIYRINQDGISQRIASGQVVRGVVQANGKMWVANATTNKLNEIKPIPLNTQLLPQFEKDIERAARYFLSNYKDNSGDKTVHALRLMGLGEARLVLNNGNLLARLDNAIYYEEQWLRERQNDDGGWGRHNNQASDSLITALVGLALEYADPMKNDLMVRRAIMYLLNTQARDGSWINRNNGLSTRLAATSFVMAYLPKALERLRPLSDFEFNAILEATTPAACKFYAINDKGQNSSQFLVFNVDSRLENFTVNQLGRTHKGFDLESLAIHPVSKIIYVTSGDDVGLGKFPGHLYVIDGNTGKITLPIGSTGFEEVDSITFAADGTLWGWAKAAGLITIDTRTGEGTLVLPAADILVEDLTMAKNGANIFYGSVDTALWKFQPDTNSLNVLCDNLPGETESLEMLTDKLLLLGTHGGKSLQVFDIEKCQLENAVHIPTEKFKDVEGIGVITEDCPLGELVETAINMIAVDPNKQICLSLAELEAGNSVEGLDTLYTGFNIFTFGNEAVVIEEGKEPDIYYAGANAERMNGCIGKGFADKKRHHNYVFSFETGATVSEVLLWLLDYGDENPTEASRISVSLVGMGYKDQVVATDTLSFKMDEGQAYRDGELFGSGDACLDQPGELGNYQFKLSGTGITKFRLKYKSNQTGSQPSDPNFAIGEVCFTFETLPSKLLRHLPKQYISDLLNDFISNLRHKLVGQLSKEEILKILSELQREFFREYVNGLPNDLLREFLSTLPDEVPETYPDELLDDIFEEFINKNFERKLLQEVGRDFIIEHLRHHLGETLQHLKDAKVLPLLPTKILRRELSEIVGDMMGKLTSDLLAEVSGETLLEILDELPVYILNKLLDGYDTAH